MLKQILLVDDSPRDTELALDALQQYRLANDVVPLRDGDEALDYLHCRGEFAGRKGDLPAVVLLDLKMPKLDGLDVLRRMRSDPRLKLIPVVMMTSSREERDVIESYACGVNAYVVKPLDFHEFTEAIRLLGSFWAILNEPPRSRERAGQAAGHATAGTPPVRLKQ